MFTEIEKQLRDSLLYHRRKVRIHFTSMFVIAILILIGGLLFGGYLIQLLNQAASAAISAKHAGIEFSASSGEAGPDIMKTATENNLGYFMLSGLIVFLFALIGLLKHHIARASLMEDRLFTIQKSQALSVDSVPEEVIKALLDQEEAPQAVAINPTTELIEKITDGIVSRVQGLTRN
ncbi:hypothetical protein Q8G38_07950 [Halomonas venusta]|uniref:hypothetical protein n=1 Tax=Vreelandella venusta TaxID=44935 RepID=UPI00295E8253|nr:hypothetical protein [Halomonas venusta]MDW0359247.1 hypothetical protein [Halomonas venusta]